ncbi:MULTISPECIES: hypothetical protein [Chryseobacterium]|uniref:hypothetical protein n=1 Tax=Chryseobacterium TaxID=59732 RepID=UPI00129509FA|nr:MULTISPECIES: hypothetical protein [Chryseobacterium]MDR6920240.1 hypothetical protein [Chryseobacterium sp. 2987]
MHLLKKFKIIYGVIFIFILLGCSIPTDFYIQNLTQTNKVVKINYARKITNALNNDGYGHFSFNYQEDIVKPRVFKRNKNLRSLEKISITDSLITIEIPPHSTVRIEKTHNYYWVRGIRSVEIDGQNFDIKELREKSEEIKDDYVYKIQ